jgi:hypothetical protein
MASARITRRAVLGSAGAASLSPMLAASARGAPGDESPHAPQPRSRAAFAAEISVGAAEPVAGSAHRRWAAVLGGEIAGPALSGAVQGGRIDWSIDEHGQTVELTARFGVLCPDGRLFELRDRAVYQGVQPPAHSAVIVTAPQLLEAAAEVPAAPALLVGRLDASQFRNGTVRLLAFEVS